MISEELLRRYHEDGVVCLRRCFDAHCIELARCGIERNMASPGPFFRDHTSRGSRGRYVFDFWTWRDIPEFERLIFDSPLAALGSEILGTRAVRLLMDNWFVREAGSADGAPWHHDEPYFDFEGRMCIVWFPLERVEAAEGLTFVRGSHAWGRLYAARQFSENVTFECSGEDYAPMPDLDEPGGGHELLSWALDPGDCLVFDFRTLHRASDPHRAADKTTRRMTLRMGTDEVLFRPRGPWTREISEHLIALGQRPGERLSSPLTPLLSTEG